jgi:hypothetical protein
MRILARSLCLTAVVAWTMVTSAPAPEMGCVPATCCHPTSCVPAAEAPDCSDVACDGVECQPGSLDCDQGRCIVNEDGKCDVKRFPFEPGPTAPPLATERRRCQVDDECVPYPCCEPAGCVSPEEASSCALAGVCPPSEGRLFDGCICQDGFCNLPPPPQHDEPRNCETDNDCAPFPCCQPSGCVSPGEALLCTIVDCMPHQSENFAFEGCSCVEGKCSLPPPVPQPPVLPMGSPCQHHSDCVPNDCCRPNHCVNPEEAPLDCGMVPCYSFAYEEWDVNCWCDVSTWTCGWDIHVYTPTHQCMPRCAPRECCHATECVLAEDAPDCSATLCSAECQEGSLADWCGQAYCRYDEASQSCVVEKPTPHPQPLPPSDPECAAGDCCHPAYCVLVTDAPVCDNATCTEECRSGTLDCGYGRCVYDRDSCNCRIEFSAPEPTPPPTSDPRCAGGECCHSTFCVLAGDAPTCDNVPCTMDCRAGTLDCGFGYCVYDEELNQCHIEFVEATSEPPLPPPPPPSDPECTGGQCCHSTFCVLASEPPVCPQDLPCTEECRSGTLDCGYGRCAYDSQSKTCSIQFATVHPDGTIDWIKSDSRCAPTKPCRATSCSLISGGPGDHRGEKAASEHGGKAAAEKGKAAAETPGRAAAEKPCDDSCKPDTLDCGQGRCYFNEYSQTCGVQLFDPKHCETDDDCVMDSCCSTSKCTNIASRTTNCALVKCRACDAGSPRCFSDSDCGCVKGVCRNTRTQRKQKA